MAAEHTSETSVNFNVTTRRYIPEDSKLPIEPVLQHKAADTVTAADSETKENPKNPPSYNTKSLTLPLQLLEKLRKTKKKPSSYNVK
jgi:hypothetical protein